MTNQVSREDVVRNVKHAFVFRISPFVTSKDITQEQANLYFKTIFDCPDLVEMIWESLKSSDSDTFFSGVDYAKEDSLLIAQDEFDTVKFHSRHEDFSIYIKETYEPRDCATYFTFVFRQDK